jgi:hypothetical protein
VLCWGIVSAEALDGSEDVIGGLGPSEGLGISVASVDKRCDVGPEGSGAAIDPHSLIGKDCEEALDLVEQ